MRHAPARRTAWTLLDVVVALLLGIVVLGLGIMLIFRQRDLGYRAHCLDNLRRIGAAFLVFQDHSPKLNPDGGTRFLPASCIDEGYATWAVQILPHLQADHPLAQWDLSHDYFAQDAAIVAQPVAVYFCPQRRRGFNLSLAGEVAPARGEHVPGALGDYACVSGDGGSPSWWTAAEANGPIIPGQVLRRDGRAITAWQGRVSQAALTRGTQYTLMVGEKHVPEGRYGDAAGGDGSIYDGYAPASFARAAGPGHPLAQTRGEALNAQFGSAHAGVCGFLMADGSAQFMTTDINPEILGQLARR